MNDKQAELAIIQEVLTQITGYDEGVDCERLSGQALEIRHNIKLKTVMMLLRAKEAKYKHMLVHGYDVDKELKDVQNKISLFESWE